MQRFHLVLALLIVAAVGAMILAGNGFFTNSNEALQVELGNNDTENSDPDSTSKPKPKSLSEILGVDEEDMVEVGGVKRPKRDIAFSDSNLPEPSTESPFPNAGRAPAVAADANPQVAGLFKELQQENPPLAAKSAMFAPEPFDQAKYNADPDSWLSTIRPGRVFQSAQPGPDVQPIATESKAFQSILQGEKVILKVKAKPGAPVTFYTPQVGEFENRLTTQSVAANDEGIATAVYTATPGTLGLVNIIAASPLNSGRLNFNVRVSLPK